MPSLQAAIDFMVTACRDWSLGYSQANRWNIYDGGECDCSSLVIKALQAGGFDTGGATYTGNMSSNLTARGWVRLPNDGNPKPGDILLNDSDHVALMVNSWQLAQASIDENGNIAGGIPGDQGNETNIRSYYNYPWDCYLRWNGGEGSSSHYGEYGYGVTYEVHTSDGWLGSVSKADDSSDGFAGWNGKPIDGIRAYMDGRELRIQAIMSDGAEWSWTTFNGSMWGQNEDGDGYAGNIDSGSYIIGLRVYGAKCRVQAGGGWLGWTEGDNPTPEGDNFAGEDLWKKQPITAVQMCL